MLKLKLHYFAHLMQRTDSLEKALMLGKTEGKKRRGQQRMRWLDSIADSMDMNLSKLRGIVKGREACHIAVHGVTNSRTQHSNWTITTSLIKEKLSFASEPNSVLFYWHEGHRAEGSLLETDLRGLVKKLEKDISKNQSTAPNSTWTYVQQSLTKY